ncbi:MAG: hypothetical protein K2P84_05895 [Undibacterium sp.]|nr:hypothetical protein [Undibacterium sp.]
MSNPIPSNVAQRLNYQTGMFLTSSDMTLEQNYFINWFCLQNQYLFSPGVLNGMLVTQQNNSLAVSQGVAFDSNGNFLIVPADSNNAVAVPANPTNPFLVWAVYPVVTGQTAQIINTAAQVAAGQTLPSGAVLLATVEVDANYQITKVTDSRGPVTSLLPSLSSVSNMSGQASVPTTTLTALASTVSQKVYYQNSQQNVYSSPPNVSVTVLGTVAFAVAVAPDLAFFTLTLTALGPTPSGISSINVNWCAEANTTGSST